MSLAPSTSITHPHPNNTSTPRKHLAPYAVPAALPALPALPACPPMAAPARGCGSLEVAASRSCTCKVSSATSRARRQRPLSLSRWRWSTVVMVRAAMSWARSRRLRGIRRVGVMSARRVVSIRGTMLRWGWRWGHRMMFLRLRRRLQPPLLRFPPLRARPPRTRHPLRLWL